MSDWHTVLLVQVVLGGMTLFAMVRAAWARQRQRHSNLKAEIIRGPESKRRFGVVYGFASVIALQVINSSEAFKGHKVLLSLLDLLFLFYLCFLNSWSRGMIIGWMSKWEATPE